MIENIFGTLMLVGAGVSGAAGGYVLRCFMEGAEDDDKREGEMLKELDEQDHQIEDMRKQLQAADVSIARVKAERKKYYDNQKRYRDALNRINEMTAAFNVRVDSTTVAALRGLDEVPNEDPTAKENVVTTSSDNLPTYIDYKK